MKLILLRHDERDLSNPLFFTPLTDNGMRHRYDLVEPLKKQNIDVIYASPYLRTMETIYPTAKELGKKVNVEYGIGEYIHNPKFDTTNWYHEVEELYGKHPYLRDIVNMEYRSKVRKSDFHILENENDVEKRIGKFMNEMMKEHKNDTVLLVTHGGIINKIKDMYVTRTKMNADFPMGHFEIYYV